MRFRTAAALVCFRCGRKDLGGPTQRRGWAGATPAGWGSGSGLYIGGDAVRDMERGAWQLAAPGSRSASKCSDLWLDHSPDGKFANLIGGWEYWSLEGQNGNGQIL